MTTKEFVDNFKLKEKTTRRDSRGSVGINSYIVIDPLYIMDIKEYISVNGFLEIEENKDKVFPYPCTEYPYSILENKDIFKIENVKKIIDINLIINKSFVFATDTGVILIIRQDLFLEFVKEFDYDSFVSDSINVFDFEYWEYFSKKYKSGFILSNYKSNFEFDGSGLFYFNI